MCDSLEEEPKRVSVRLQSRPTHMAHILLNPNVVPDRGELGHDKVIIFDGRVKPRPGDVLHDPLEAGLVRMGELVPEEFVFLQQPSRVCANIVWQWCARAKHGLVEFQWKRVTLHVINSREVLLVNLRVVGIRGHNAPVQLLLLLQPRVRHNLPNRPLIMHPMESSRLILRLRGRSREGGGKIATALKRKVRGNGNGLGTPRGGDEAQPVPGPFHSIRWTRPPSWGGDRGFVDSFAPGSGSEAVFTWHRASSGRSPPTRSYSNIRDRAIILRTTTSQPF